MNSLSKVHVMKVVNRYIGVSGGYLGDFTYRTHAEFYPEYCDLDINPNEIEGTTRERFIEILSSSDPPAQAKILVGVTERFPVLQQYAPPTRTAELKQEIELWAARLAGSPAISSPNVSIDSDVVRQALSDVEILIANSGPTSAVDRVHTALHGYLEAFVRQAGIAAPDDANVTKIFKLLRTQHPALLATGPRAGDITTVLRSLSAALDALNTVRNKASAAHPRQRLDAPEAMVAIHAAHTIFHYVESCLRRDGEKQ